MAENYSIWALGRDNILIDGLPVGDPLGRDLSGFTQGDGSHMAGATLQLNNYAAATEIFIEDNTGDSTFDDSDGNQRLDGAQSFNGVSYADGRRVEAEYELEVTDGTTTYRVIAFNINEAGSAFPAYGTVEGLAFIGQFPPEGATLTVVSAGEGPKGSTEDDNYAAPCFTPGTRIETPTGARRVEDLRPGDLVLTRDAGAQPLRWVGSVRLSAADLAARPALAPVRIRAGAFGPGRPGRDLLVSPQHRVLLDDWRAELLFDAPEVLVAATHLVNDASVLRDPGVGPVRYLHLLFDEHHILTADGLACESFRPGQTVLSHLEEAVQDEIFALFPELRTGAEAPFAAARPLLRGWEGGLCARFTGPAR